MSKKQVPLLPTESMIKEAVKKAFGDAKRGARLLFHEPEMIYLRGGELKVYADPELSQFFATVLSKERIAYYPQGIPFFNKKGVQVMSLRSRVIDIGYFQLDQVFSRVEAGFLKYDCHLYKDASCKEKTTLQYKKGAAVAIVRVSDPHVVEVVEGNKAVGFIHSWHFKSILP